MSAYEEKLQAERAHYAAQQQQNLGAAQTEGYRGDCEKSSYRPSPAEEAEKDFRYYGELAQKRGEAAKFLQQHPEFSRFIELIRKGAIGI